MILWHHMWITTDTEMGSYSSTIDVSVWGQSLNLLSSILTILY